MANIHFLRKFHPLLKFDQRVDIRKVLTVLQKTIPVPYPVPSLRCFLITNSLTPNIESKLHIATLAARFGRRSLRHTFGEILTVQKSDLTK